MSLNRQTPERVAWHMTKLLVGDGNATVPTEQAGHYHNDTPVRAHFRLMTLEDALEEFDQLYQLPEGDRLRDLMERMDEDR